LKTTLPSFSASFFEDVLQELSDGHLLRKARVLESTGPVTARLDGKEVLLFCGNDYLGFSHHAKIIEAFTRTAKIKGVGSGAARLISGTSEFHARLEEKIADFKAKKRAVLYTAGYLANLGTLTALAGKKDLIVMDKLCHASLIDGAKFSGAEVRVFPHKNYSRCEELLEKTREGGRKILVSDTVFSMDGDLADIARLISLKKKHGAFLVLDDAHGTGVMGLSGRGATEGFEHEIDIITGTLSKAAGCLGGFAAASGPIVDYLINFSRPFIFATSMPPALCAAAREALDIMEKEPKWRLKLWENIETMRGLLKKAGFSVPAEKSPILPIVIGTEELALKAAENLLIQGLLIPAVRTPTVAKGKARLRVTISAAHEKEDLSRLSMALHKAIPEALRGNPL
jgi:8-amino-7-oxononanoate synthase